MCCPTRSMIFLLIVDKLQILDVLPYEINDFLLIVDKLQTLDLLPHGTIDFSTHRGQIKDFGCVAPRDQ
ncbi:hypothetical protein TNCV_2743711 [Trichonephila clavipes]|nr:hypothetical protein TNCV_2743711 [Trichonephila clavipes]